MEPTGEFCIRSRVVNFTLSDWLFHKIQGRTEIYLNNKQKLLFEEVTAK
jgi:hypothetical protein